MAAHDFIGSLAAALSMFTFLPQAIRVIRTGDTSAISLTTYLIVVVSTLLWASYGVLIASAPVIIANVVNCAFGSVVLVRKMIDMRRRR
ncbi:MAG: SemiSWEET family sugar transporter [Pseudomonadota bacterium]